MRLMRYITSSIARRQLLAHDCQRVLSTSELPRPRETHDADNAEYMVAVNDNADFFHTPNRYTRAILKNMKVLFLCDAENSLAKYMKWHLAQFGVDVTTREVTNQEDIEKAWSSVQHEVIVCPILTTRVPDTVTEKSTCLIVHPGILGDRGGNSLDWAIKEQRKHWGVTVMAATSGKKVDAGSVYATRNFDVKDGATKTGCYVSDVADAAVSAVTGALLQHKLDVEPLPLEAIPDVGPGFRPLMKNRHRMIDWSSSPSDIAALINASDTKPGALGYIKDDSRRLRFFGVKVFDSYGDAAIRRRQLAEAEPGEVIGHKNEAILVKCGQGEAVWISHLKDDTERLKLPATMVVQGGENLSHLQCYREIWTEVKDGIGYLHFDFYNGAMSIRQCNQLAEHIRNMGSDPSLKALVLMGGFRFFSTGIHLNVIEGSRDPVVESNGNIVAIDDVIREAFSITNKLVISCLQGNAGAGGAMMAASTDYVIAHKAVVLTPTYKSMDLYGSEYWTYFLPRRVGEEVANQLVNQEESYLAGDAAKMGLVDLVIGRNRDELQKGLHQAVTDFVYSPEGQSKLKEKELTRDTGWFELVDQHRQAELSKMKQCFASEEYKLKRQAFVYH